MSADATPFDDFTTPAKRILEQAVAFSKQDPDSPCKLMICSLDVMKKMLDLDRTIAQAVLREAGVSSENIDSIARSAGRHHDIAFADLINQARKDVEWLGHSNPGTEHVLLALCVCANDATREYFRRLQIFPRTACQLVFEILGREWEFELWVRDQSSLDAA